MTASLTTLSAAANDLIPPPGARALRLKAALHDAGYSICLERPRLLKAFRKSGAGKGEHPLVQRALALAHVMKHRQPRLYDDELIIGNVSSKRVGANFYPEGTSVNIIEDLFKLQDRPIKLKLSRREQLELAALAADNVFTNMGARAFARPGFTGELLEILTPKRYIVTEEAGVGHQVGDYRRLVEEGLVETDRIAARCLDTRTLPDGTPADADQLAFYRSLRITIDGIRAMATNLADAAERDALRTDISDQRRAELLAAAQACRRVPYYPPATFQEGLQACWLLHIAMLLEDFEQGMSFGRLDQALIHLYEADLARGALTREQALELWVSFEAKTGETIPLYSNRMDVYFSGNAVGQSITVGGVDAEGHDVSNELSELVLEAFGQLGTREPALHVRVHDQTPKRLLDKAVAVMQRTGGRPTLMGDETVIRSLQNTGMTLEHARDYAIIGCVELASQGRTYNSADAALFNLPLCLELALNRGETFRGERLGLLTPPLAAMHGFNDVLAAFRAQVAFQVGQMQRAINRLEETYRVHRPTPVNSIMTQGCLAKGKDVTWGGGLYDYTSVQAVGLADAGDSLYALNKLVFEDRRFTLPQLVEMLKADFAGHEPLRVELSRRFPRFGNGDKAADAMTQRAADAFTDAVTPRRNTRGGKWIAGFYSMSCGVGFGKHIGALPNGRKAGQRLSNGVSPSDGSDRKGPTAALRSVAGLDKSQWANAHVLNIKFDKKLVHGDTGIRNLGTLFRDYLVRQDGMQVQVNVQDAEVLRAAKLNPEAYPDLLVRVSGYCSYFSDLRPEVQDEIIERMSHGL